jgi:stage V sporulation protein B
MMTTNSILLGVNKANLSMINVGIGILVKLAGSCLLALWFGIYGIIAATGLCFLVITLLNLRMLKVIVPFSILGKRWTGFLVTVILTSAVGYGLNELGILMTHIMPARLAFLITCMIVGGAVVILYLVLLIMFGVLRQHELASYPRKVQKLLRPLMRPQPSRFKTGNTEEGK